MKSVLEILKSMEKEVTVPLTERHAISVLYGHNESEYQAELFDWIERISMISLEMQNHIKNNEKKGE